MTHFSASAIAHRIVAETDIHRGGTFNVTNGEQYDHSGHAHAFAVAVGRGTTITWAPENANCIDCEEREELHRIITNTVRNARVRECLVGTWIDEDVWYIDFVDIVTDPVLAIVEGRTRGELAVYDLKNNREYRCNNDAETLASIREWYGITDIPALPQ